MEKRWTKQLLLLAAVLLPFWALAQHRVTGVVTGDGEPLIGVNILVKGSSVGTITELDGSYVLEVPSPNDTLSFSYIGYQTRLVPIAGRTQVDLEMAAASELLEEVVVIGYGVQRKEDLTGSVAVVSSESIEKIPTTSLGQSLQGRVAGLQVTPSSGAPGDDAVFRVRGTGTFGDASPATYSRRVAFMERLV